jgi:hypothetical protein
VWCGLPVRPLEQPWAFADRPRTGSGIGIGIGIERRGSGSCWSADLDHVDGPRESRLVRVRRVATADEHAPRGIEPALDVVVHVMASHVYPLPQSGEPRLLDFRGRQTILLWMQDSECS